MMGIGMAVRPPRSRGPVLMMIDALRRIGGNLWMVDNAFSGAFVDNAGTTPVTAVGDLIGKVLDKTGTNHATQSAVASKPSVQRVPKRTRGAVNQLLWSGDFSNVVWTSSKSAGATVGALTAGPDGQLSARLVTFAGAVDFLYQAFTSYTTAVGQVVTFAMVCSTATQAFGFGGSTPAGTNTYVAHDLTGGWWLQVLTRTFTAATTGTLQLLPSNGYGLSAGVTVAYHRAALFQGPVTAQQIIDNGGIPLTTTTALPNVLEWANVISFDGSNDFLQTGVTTGNEGFVAAGVTPSSITSYRSLLQSGVLGSVRGIWLLSDLGRWVFSANNGSVTYSTGYITAKTSPDVVVGGWTASTVLLEVDGATSSSARAGDCTGTTPLRIGITGSDSFPFAGNLHAIAYAPVLPSEADRKIIRDGIAALQGRTL